MNNYFFAAHLVLVVPEDVGRRLGAELDEAGEVDSGPDVYVQVRPAEDARRRHCNATHTAPLVFVGSVKRYTHFKLVPNFLC